jgi:aryl-alcohol dehydrogenase-like predicted oxidoreductase
VYKFKGPMEKRTLGKTGMDVTVLGFGGAEIGYQSVSLPVVSRLLNSALDAGLNVIDTAECYPNGEELIGQAVSARRSEYHLFTKCGHDKDGDHWNPGKMAEQIDRGLSRLKTDHADLLQLHSCTGEQLRQGDVIEVVKRARDAGKTRFIGYSGDSRAALDAVESGVFDTLQISVNIADQESIGLAVPAAHARGMGVIAKRPIANAVWKHASKPDPYYQTYWERLAALQYDFLGADFQKAVSIALRFTLTVPGVHTAIVGTTQPDRWRQNAELLKDGALDSHQFDAIRERWNSVSGPDWLGQT